MEWIVFIKLLPDRWHFVQSLNEICIETRCAVAESFISHVQLDCLWFIGADGHDKHQTETAGREVTKEVRFKECKIVSLLAFIPLMHAGFLRLLCNLKHYFFEVLRCKNECFIEYFLQGLLTRYDESSKSLEICLIHLRKSSLIHLFLTLSFKHQDLTEAGDELLAIHGNWLIQVPAKPYESGLNSKFALVGSLL